MKKPIFIVSAFAVLAIASCSSNESKTENVATDKATVVVEETKTEPEVAALIVGTWKLTEVDLGMVAPKGQEKTFDDLKKDMIAKTIYTFGEDGSLNMESNLAKSTGTYTLSGNKLTTVLNKKTESVVVESITTTELVIAIDDRGTKTVMKFKK